MKKRSRTRGIQTVITNKQMEQHTWDLVRSNNGISGTGYVDRKPDYKFCTTYCL